MNQSEREAIHAALDALRMPCDFWNKTQYLKVMETIKLLEDALAAHEPEIIGWATHHEPPMLFPTKVEAEEYCDDDEKPIALITKC